MRNAKAAAAIRKKYKATTTDPHTLEVQCVSSTHYELHKEGIVPDCNPVSLPATGIPSLRSLFSKFPAASKLEVLKGHIEGTVPALIHSMDMWSHQSKIQRQLEIRKAVAKPQKVPNLVYSKSFNLKT